MTGSAFWGKTANGNKKEEKKKTEVRKMENRVIGISVIS
jgi:hypothetical protein